MSKESQFDWGKLEIIQSAKRCIKCGNKLLLTVEVEPLKPEYFTINKKQKCIVECSQCNARYIASYD